MITMAKYLGLYPSLPVPLLPYPEGGGNTVLWTLTYGLILPNANREEFIATMVKRDKDGMNSALSVDSIMALPTFMMGVAPQLGKPANTEAMNPLEKYGMKFLQVHTCDLIFQDMAHAIFTSILHF